MLDTNGLYYDYNETVCPVCGRRIKHPYTGEVTSEQIDEDINCCLWGEVIDESNSTVGYRPICRNVYKVNMKMKC